MTVSWMTYLAVQSDIAQRIAEKFAIDLSTSAKKDLNARPTNNRKLMTSI